MKQESAETQLGENRERMVKLAPANTIRHMAATQPEPELVAEAPIIAAIQESTPTEEVAPAKQEEALDLQTVASSREEAMLSKEDTQGFVKEEPEVAKIESQSDGSLLSSTDEVISSVVSAGEDELASIVDADTD